MDVIDAPVLAGPAAADHFARTGWVLTAPLDARSAAALPGWVEEVAAGAERPTGASGATGTDETGGVLHYRETTPDGPRLCRSENFVPSHAGLRRLLTDGALLDLASLLLGEPAVLYKEKVNYKAPGGAGYAAHQDAPAYRFVEVHVSCMVAVDDATAGNGCLEVVSGAHGELLPTDDAGCVRADVAASLTWQAVEVHAGQVLWFHSRTPHRSGPNTSDTWRRALYPTYNARREGDLRAAYYRRKLDEFAASAATGERRVPVSLIGDFQGTVLP